MAGLLCCIAAEDKRWYRSTVRSRLHSQLLYARNNFFLQELINEQDPVVKARLRGDAFQRIQELRTEYDVSLYGERVRAVLSRLMNVSVVLGSDRLANLGVSIARSRMLKHRSA